MVIEDGHAVNDDSGRSMKGKVQQGLDQARDVVEEQADAGRRAVANRLGELAGSIHDAEATLERDEAVLLSRFVGVVADRVDDLSGYFRSKDAGEVIDDVAGYARRHPECILAAAVAGGVLVGRFLKSSADRRRIEADRTAAQAMIESKPRPVAPGFSAQQPPVVETSQSVPSSRPTYTSNPKYSRTRPTPGVPASASQTGSGVRPLRKDTNAS